MATTFTYVNNFNLTVGTASSATTGSNVGIAEAEGTDSDTEYVYFSGANESATLDLNKAVAAGKRVSNFMAEMELDFWQTGAAPYGNRQPDGFSFSYGAPGTLDTEQKEYGLSTGLSVQVRPYSGWSNGNSVNILWNNQIIGSTPLTGFALAQPAATLSISVDDTGQVSVNWGGYSASGNIPGGLWHDTAQDGWDFVLAGRTGANSAGAYIDNLAVQGTVICFTAETLITTRSGEVPIQRLEPGDMVKTLDNGFQPLRWMSRRELTATELDANPRLRPIRIEAGALGGGLPSTDLSVSPQHRLLARGPISERMFGEPEVLVAARNLIATPGIEVDTSGEPVSYFHLLFDRHEIVFANDAPAESMLTAPGALAALSPMDLGEVVANVPEILDPAFTPEPVRTIPPAQKQRKLVARACANRQPICVA